MKQNDALSMLTSYLFVFFCLWNWSQCHHYEMAFILQSTLKFQISETIFYIYICFFSCWYQSTR